MQDSVVPRPSGIISVGACTINAKGPEYEAS